MSFGHFIGDSIGGGVSGAAAVAAAVAHPLVAMTVNAPTAMDP